MTAAVYAISLPGPFLYDDTSQLALNERLHDITDLHAVIFCGLRQLRPLLNIIYAACWSVSGGEPWSFRVVNIALHLGNAVMLLAWLGRLFPGRNVLAQAATILFLLHPLQTQGVSYVMGMVSPVQLATMLGALLLANSRGLYVVLLVGVLTKESGIFTPWLVILQQYAWGQLHRRHWAGVLVSLVFIPMVLFLADPRDAAFTAQGFHLAPVVPYTLREFAYYLLHAWLLVSPAGQALIHEPPPMEGGILVVGAVVGVALVAAAVWAFVNLRRHTGAALLVLFFGICLGPTNTFIPVVNPFAEYRLYAANVAAFAAMGWATEWAWNAVSGRVLRAVVVTVPLGYLAAFNVSQQWMWRDGVSLVRYSLAEYPHSVDLLMLLGGMLEERGDLAGAREQYERAEERLGGAGRTLRARFALARVRFRSGDAEGALQQLDQMPIHALAGPPPTDYWTLRLQVLRALGDRTAFEAVLEQARAQYPQLAWGSWDRPRR